MIFRLNKSSIKEGQCSDNEGKHIYYSVDVVAFGRTIWTITCSDHEDSDSAHCQPDGIGGARNQFGCEGQNAQRYKRVLKKWSLAAAEIAEQAMHELKKSSRAALN